MDWYEACDVRYSISNGERSGHLQLVIRPVMVLRAHDCWMIGSSDSNLSSKQSEQRSAAVGEYYCCQKIPLYERDKANHDPQALHAGGRATARVTG